MFCPSKDEAATKHRKRSFSDSSLESPDMGLKEDHASANKTFSPRKYQSQVFEVAMKRNTIAVLETGTGKTMIAVMLINAIGEAVKSAGEKKLIFFLAPTVHLVQQQHQVITTHTNFQVGEYYGAKGVDDWTLECWNKEINDHDVLVMTPQIFLDALRKAFVTLDMVRLLILDECHRASGNHPYAKIMQEFYHRSSSKPKIFGMTASPVARKGNSEGLISELESSLDSQIYTVQDKTEMNVHVHYAKESVKVYRQAGFGILDLKAKIEYSLPKFDTSLISPNSEEVSCKDIVDKSKILHQRIFNAGAKILHCLENLGPICAFEAVKICLESEVHRENSSKYKLFLEEVSRLVRESFLAGHEVFLNSDFDYFEAVELGYVSPKLHELIQLFSSFGEASEVLCLIFVERIITAAVIQNFVKKVSKLSHFKVSYLTGSNSSVDGLTPKEQKETLESFRSGKINLLFTTDVVEEGIDIPNCSCVIRFDLPKTVRSYVQSRGQARQDKSQFIILLESANMDQRNLLYEIMKSEQIMMDTALDRNPEDDYYLPKAPIIEETHIYTVKATGASVTAASSISLLNEYCQKLPADKYCIPKPSFESTQFTTTMFGCKITLPANAPFLTLSGPVCKNSRLAKQLACLEACKKLHQMGALNDHLLPFTEAKDLNHLIAQSKQTLAGPGTTKRKELHGTTPIRALTGSWGGSADGFKFHAYKFDFNCNILTKSYSGFVLLMESKLENDVGNIDKINLFLIGKIVRASVTSSGQLHLNAEQMMKARSFQEFFFNGLFGKLYLGEKSTGGQRRSIFLQNETDKLWSPQCMYFLLPIDVSSNQPWQINWEGVNAGASMVEFLKTNSILTTKPCEIEKGKRVPSSKDASFVNFADNRSVAAADLKDMVVLAIHTGKLYSIVKVVDNSSADSPFDGAIDGAQSEISSFTEYFLKKYGIALMYPKQRLLRLKQSHNPHNLLVDFDSEGSSMASQTKEVKKKPQFHINMPPELLVIVNVPIDVVNSFYLLPSMMQRLESLMLASQLREEINCRLNNFHIPSSLILEAITTRRCCEDISMERMELLGDSVLKYAVSCHLFLRYSQKHEGQLSSQRSSAVCNANLHRLATDRKLQGYIRDSAFDPRRWVAPGQLTVRPVPCKCGCDASDAKFLTEDPKVKIGKCCDMGHRWMVSKTVADCVEALIGAYYVCGGLEAAIHVMKWLGLDLELDPLLVTEAINRASARDCVLKDDEIDSLESKIGYKFAVNSLLQEAISHSSMHHCSYERLEFLGDSVLDLLITKHLYESYSDIDQGELTDLRSASVNNESFARVAVRKGIYGHLQHSSAHLLSEITEYVKSFPEPMDDISAPSIRGPKALGDLVESIAGAVLIDLKLNTDEVWRIFKPLLSPIVTPEKLELPPLRELIELCGSLGYFIKEKSNNKGENMYVELRVQLEEALLIGEGLDHNRKHARGRAASQLLKELEKRGISRSYPNSNERDTSSFVDLANNMANGNESSRVNDFPEKASINTPVIASINMMKGGPRTTLMQLCMKLQWPMPKFETDEQKSRTLMEFGEGAEQRKGFNSFISKIILHIPNVGSMECRGEARADKKSSYDSAATMMLYKLQEEGKLVIGDRK